MLRRRLLRNEQPSPLPALDELSPCGADARALTVLRDYHFGGIGLVDACNHNGHTLAVIRSFKHKWLQRFFLEGTKSGIQPPHAERLRLILGWMGASVEPKDMDLPGLKLHRLKGDRKDTWSVWVSGSWRITFAFDGEDAINIDYEDYH